MELLSNNINLNAAARILRVNPKTVAKKLRFLGLMCQKMNMNNCQNYSQINICLYNIKDLRPFLWKNYHSNKDKKFLINIQYTSILHFFCILQF